MTKQTVWLKTDSAKAKQIWMDYQQNHDISNRVGQTAGIDPENGRIWFGDSIHDIVTQRDKEGLTTLLYFERVGSESYLCKRGCL